MNQEEMIKIELEKLGFEVEKLEEREGVKTPDFYVQKENDTYFIELKTKEINPQVIVEMNQAFQEGRIHESAIPLQHNGTFQKIIHKAKAQLEAEPVYEDQNAFKIVWFHCEGIDASAYMEIFENILYGIVYCADFEDKSNNIAWKCYFYHNIAMFMKYKNILDGAVISMDGSLRIFPNILSEKYPYLKRSSLFRIFREGENDPFDMEKDKKALIVDQSLNREMIDEEIMKKYKLKSFQIVPMTSYTISAPSPSKTGRT